VPGLVGAIVGIVAGIITVLVDGREIHWPEWVKGKKWSKAILVFVVVGAVSTGLTFGGYLIANRTGELEKLGGVDLTGYCTSFNFAGAKEMGCESKIDLGDACDKRFNRVGDSMEFTDPNDPNSGVCYTATGRNTESGVDNLSQYCQQMYPLALKVKSVSSPPHNWVCRTSIDPTLVCSWRYQSRDAVARTDADKQVECYKKKPL
jgi:hypothetical protein